MPLLVDLPTAVGAEGSCERYDGVAVMERLTPQGFLAFGVADAHVHLSADLVHDLLARCFIQQAYVVRERCPALGAWHAVRAERPLPTWSAADALLRLQALHAAIAAEPSP